MSARRLNQDGASMVHIDLNNSKFTPTGLLLVPQCNQRVDLHRAACWKEAREQRNRNQQ